MWIHESFANYSEGIYTECRDGKQAGAEYIIGSRTRIQNDRPIIAPYGVNAEGSGDMYYKGGSMLHTIRQLVNDDEKWRQVLRGLQSTFWHQTVTAAQVEDYMSRRSGVGLSKVFEQYLTTTMVPLLEYRAANGELSYRWQNVVPGFAMPVRANGVWLKPTTQWKSGLKGDSLTVDKNFYVEAKAAPPT